MKIEKPEICYVPDIIQLIMVSLAVKEDGLRLIISLPIYKTDLTMVLPP